MTLPLTAAVLDEIQRDPASAAAFAEAIRPYVHPPATAPGPDEWYDTKRAAEYLSLTVNAIHKLTAARAIPFEQDGPGCKCWFKPSELDDWRRGREAHAANSQPKAA
jgi:hypothetical protein